MPPKQHRTTKKKKPPSQQQVTQTGSTKKERSLVESQRLESLDEALKAEEKKKNEEEKKKKREEKKKEKKEQMALKTNLPPPAALPNNQSWTAFTKNLRMAAVKSQHNVDQARILEGELESLFKLALTTHDRLKTTYESLIDWRSRLQDRIKKLEVLENPTPEQHEALTTLQTNDAETSKALVGLKKRMRDINVVITSFAKFSSDEQERQQHMAQLHAATLASSHPSGSATTSGQFGMNLYPIPGRAADHVAGESVLPRTLLDRMRLTHKLFTNQTGRSNVDQFSPGDVGYIPFMWMSNGSVVVPGGWSKKDLIKAHELGRLYVGNAPELVPYHRRHPFGIADVIRSERFFRNRRARAMANTDQATFNIDLTKQAIQRTIDRVKQLHKQFD
jgi:hypothetical protein